MAQTTDYRQLYGTGAITTTPAVLCGMFISDSGTVTGYSRLTIYDSTSLSGTQIISNMVIVPGTSEGYHDLGNLNAHTALYAAICGTPYITFLVKQSD